MDNHILVFSLIPYLFIAGCTMAPEKPLSDKKTPVEPVPIIAEYSESPVVIDGKLDDPVWKKSPVYKLSLSKDIESKGSALQEKGEVQLAWDDNYLYLGVKFYDSDIVQENNEDQQHHYRTGDLVELFLKPEGNTWYWEIYGTPNQKKTVFWFPGRGRMELPSCYEPGMELKDIMIATEIKGTLNNWKDRDDYWTLEMAIPVKEFTKYGDAFVPGSNWKILIARYNYSRYLSKKELSMVPQLSITNYHMIEEYGKLIFER